MQAGVGNFINRREETQADFDAIGSAFIQKPVVKPFAVSDAVSAFVKTKQRDENHVDPGRFNGFAARGFAYPPTIFKQFGFRRKNNVFNFADLEINSRREGSNMRKLPPNPLEYRHCIYFVEFFDSDKAVKSFYLCEIEIVKKSVGDSAAELRSSFGGKRSAFFDIDLAKFGFGHLVFQGTNYLAKLKTEMMIVCFTTLFGKICSRYSNKHNNI